MVLLETVRHHERRQARGRGHAEETGDVGLDREQVAHELANGEPGEGGGAPLDGGEVEEQAGQLVDLGAEGGHRDELRHGPLARGPAQERGGHDAHAQLGPRWAVVDHVHSEVRSGPRATARRFMARRRRDLAVPSGIPSASATST